MRTKSLLIFLIMLLSVCGFSQEKKQADSTDIYDKIEDLSEKTKVTTFLHKMVFKTSKKKTNRSVLSKQIDLKPYHGKIIRKIEIDVKDPFGFSFEDSTEVANSWLEKTGNNIHIKTQKFVVRDLLLVEPNMPLDTLLINESGRLIRAQDFIRRVQFEPRLINKTGDSIDLYITTLDSWSIVPKFRFSSSSSRIRLLERNFFGLGHDLIFSVVKDIEKDETAIDARYNIPNIKNTFINTTLEYTNRIGGSYSRVIDVKRPFYSPLARWAGGIYFDQQFRTDSLENTQMELVNERIKYNSTDVWGGYSFRVFSKLPIIARTTNLITSLRFLNVNFTESPDIQTDSIRFFSDEQLYLGTIGIASRRFIQDEFIFNDGRIEDVPIGTVYALTFGNQTKNNKNRLYIGLKISNGRYYNWGFLSTNIEYGTFFNNSKTQQTTYLFKANYFTNLIELGPKWKMRQFVKPQFLIGSNRLDSDADRLTIDGNTNSWGSYGENNLEFNDARIPGFESDLLGTTKYVLSLQTQLYSPWEVLGFRLNPYITYNAALLTDKFNDLNKKVYSSIGVGFIIRNDYLVFSNFQLSFAYYPSIPDQGKNVFKSNIFETDDFGFQDFNLGKPELVQYN